MHQNQGEAPFSRACTGARTPKPARLGLRHRDGRHRCAGRHHPTFRPAGRIAHGGRRELARPRSDLVHRLFAPDAWHRACTTIRLSERERERERACRFVSPHPTRESNGVNADAFHVDGYRHHHAYSIGDIPHFAVAVAIGHGCGHTRSSALFPARWRRARVLCAVALMRSAPQHRRVVTERPNPFDKRRGLFSGGLRIARQDPQEPTRRFTDDRP